MKNTTTMLFKACSLSMALAGSVAFVASGAFPDVAHADSGKGNSGGKGKKAPAKTEISPKRLKKISLADELGLSAAELGALNAAHTSPKALEKASPNSRVGKVAAYRDAVLAGREIEAELVAKKAELEALPAPARSVAEIDADVEAAATDLASKQAAVTQLEADLAAAGGTDPAIEADLQAARAAVSDAAAAKATLDAEQAAAVEYEALTGEVADLEQQVEDQPEVERTLLEAAANKPVTDAVEAAVQHLLGL
jgi:hypothetical protein